VGRKLRLGKGKKAIAEFKKYDPSKVLIADLMLSYVEYGVEYIHYNGKYSMPMSNSIAVVYAQALALMGEEEILDEFAERAKKIVEGIYLMDSSEGCAIRSSYREFYG
jgi:hypothetical protein